MPAATNLIRAKCQLEDAIFLFLKGENYISPLTLAGAAEELLGKEVKAHGGENAMKRRESLNKALDGMGFNASAGLKSFSEKEYRDEQLNGPKTRAKHGEFDKDGRKRVDGRIENSKENAERMITRAIENYKSLGLQLTELMLRFQQRVDA